MLNAATIVGAALLAAVLAPGAAQAAPICSAAEIAAGTEISRTTTRTVSVVDGKTYDITTISYRQPCGAICNVVLSVEVGAGPGISTLSPTAKRLMTRAVSLPLPEAMRPSKPGSDGDALDRAYYLDALLAKEAALKAKLAALESKYALLLKDIYKYAELKRMHRNNLVKWNGVVPKSTDEAEDLSYEAIDSRRNAIKEMTNNGELVVGYRNESDEWVTANLDRFDSALSKYGDASFELRKAVVGLESTKSEIDNTIVQLEAVQAQITAMQAGATQQIKAGLPPDAGPYDWMNAINWWSTSSFAGFDDDNPANTIDGVTGQAMIGGDITLDQWMAIGFGIGANASANNLAGGTSTVAGADLILRGLFRQSDWFWFDATANYSYARVSENVSGVVDDYNFHQFGLAVGANGSLPLAEDWRLDGRLGWFGSVSQRAASTNSGGIATAAADGNFGEARAETKLVYLYEGGEVFADSALRLVTNDSTNSAGTFDAELGGGASFDLGGGASLTGRGYVIVGRSNYSELGASMTIKGSY